MTDSAYLECLSVILCLRMLLFTHITPNRGARIRHCVVAGAAAESVHDILKSTSLNDCGRTTGSASGRPLCENRREWTLGWPANALVGKAQAEPRTTIFVAGALRCLRK